MPLKVVLGICAMENKVKSKPMMEILMRLEMFKGLKITVFSQAIILEAPVEKWPLCDFFLSFYSSGFPLSKSIDYVRLRRPLLINDVEMQPLLRSRLEIYKRLLDAEINVPNHIIVNRNNQSNTQVIVEHEDSLEVDGQVISKPFVEKPFNAEDHNVFIYFPTSAGGGRQELFRKVGNNSSRYVKTDSIRRKGSFIYEEFMMTDGTDLKVYTVGANYAHAEGRKSPALDGKVERDANGKEIRYPIILSQSEKLIAKNVVAVFRQVICGFDLLRANGVSYVCDVNGFSFVKTSNKYFDDCAFIIGTMLLKNLVPTNSRNALLRMVDTQFSNLDLVATSAGNIMELRCIIAVIRHGDRTPKQKIKVYVQNQIFYDLFKKYSINGSDELKLKKPSQLQELLDSINFVLEQMNKKPKKAQKYEENKYKYIQMKTVLEMYGYFSGINRKFQLKFCNENSEKKLLLILKWGGELTNSGKTHAESLGQAFRRLYPGGTGVKGESSDNGLLRLHSTYRHDLKIYASDEGRVQMTAAAFGKGFLALEGELPPILVQMVKSANTDGLLDNRYESDDSKYLVKKKVFELLSKEKDFSNEDYKELAPCCSRALIEALKCIGNPRKACTKLLDYVQGNLEHLNKLHNLSKTIYIPLYHEENWELLLRRWRKLSKDFKPKKNNKFDLSKIPDIYDNIKYDVNNNPLIVRLDFVSDFFRLSKCLADIIVPQEYGISKEEKLEIGRCICTPLLEKILIDAGYTDPDSFVRLNPIYSKGVTTPERSVRTRLYFTSESHIHSLLSCLRFGNLIGSKLDKQWEKSLKSVAKISELNYLSQIVIMVYENPKIEDKKNKDHYHVELHLSPGVRYINSNTYKFFNYCTKREIYKNKMHRRISSDTDIIINIDPLQCNLQTEPYSKCQKRIRTKTHSSVDTDFMNYHKNVFQFSSLSESEVLPNHEINNVTSKTVFDRDSKCSSKIFPLKVLHNKLTLNELETFLQRIIIRKGPTSTTA